MKILEIICRQSIMMALAAFIGFIVLVANLLTAECAENGNTNSNPTNDGQRIHSHSGYFGAIPRNNIPLTAHPNSFNHFPQFQAHYYAPRVWRRIDTPNGTFLQPGILVPNLAARQIQRSLTLNPSAVPYTRVADRGQQSTTNIRTEHGQTSQTGSSRPAVNQATGSNSQNHHQSEKNVEKIGKPRQRSKSAPAVLRENERNVERIGKPRQKSRSAPAAYRATGSTSQIHPSQSERNIRIRKRRQRSKSAPAVLRETGNVENSAHNESIPKVEDKKMSWANMVEEEEKANEQEREKSTEKGENEDIPRRRIFVGGLTKHTTDKSLRNYFEQFGDVEEAVVIKDQENISRRFGFVRMKKANDADRALAVQNPTIDGKEVNMNLAAEWWNNTYLTSPYKSPYINKENLAYEENEQENGDGDINSRRLYVGGLSFETTNESLYDYFKQFGDVEEAVAMKEKITQKCRGDGFVTMKRQEDAKKVLRYPHPHIIYGRQIRKVKLAEPRKENAPIAHDKVDTKLIVPMGDDKKAERKGIDNNESGSNPIKNTFSALEENEDESASSTLLGETDMENSGGHGQQQKDNENSVPQIYASIVKPKSEHHPTIAAQTQGKTGGKIEEEEVEKSKASATVEHNKIQGIPQDERKHDMEEMSAFEETKADRDDEFGEGNEKPEAPLPVPIQPSSSQGKGERRGKTKKGSKNKKKKGAAKKVVAGRNEVEPSELVDLGDSENQRKSTKNKSADTGASSDYMATIAKKRAEERAKERARYLNKSLHQFPHENLLNLNIEADHYKDLLDDVLLNHLDIDPEQTIIKIGNLIEEGLRKRRLKYIRLIGLGSLSLIAHSEEYIYDKEMRDEDMATLEFLRKNPYRPDYFDDLYNRRHQIFAFYQLALAKRIAERFEVSPAHVTVEDTFEASEKEFLRKEGFTYIFSDNEKQQNLIEIPDELEEMGEMGPDEVTLIIMMNCSTKPTTDLINSYGEHWKQLILMESSMNDRYDKKHSNSKDKEDFQENRRKFKIRKPLPKTLLTEHVFQQKEVKDVQICYAELAQAQGKLADSGTKNVASEDSISKSGKLPNESHIGANKISTVSEKNANTSLSNESNIDAKNAAKQRKNQKKYLKKKDKKAGLMTSEKDGAATSVQESPYKPKEELTPLELSPKIESPNKMHDTSYVEKSNEENKEKISNVLTKELTPSKNDSEVTSKIESSYKALRDGLMASEKNGPAASVTKSSSDKVPDESENILSKGTGKMLTKKHENE